MKKGSTFLLVGSLVITLACQNQPKTEEKTTEAPATVTMPTDTTTMTVDADVVTSDSVASMPPDSVE